MSLITEHEVIIHSELEHNFPPSKVSGVIVPTEEKVVPRLLGKDFYKALLADLTPRAIADSYNSETTYAVDDEVIWDGRLYKALQAHTNVPITDTGFWALTTKFETPKYEELWKKYLANYLAQEISLPAATFGTLQAGKSGITKVNSLETGTVAATRGELGVWKDQVRNQIERCAEAMVDWIRDEVDLDAYAGEFDLVSFINVDLTGSDCSTIHRNQVIGKRRIYFRR